MVNEIPNGKPLKLAEYIYEHAGNITEDSIKNMDAWLLHGVLRMIPPFYSDDTIFNVHHEIEYFLVRTRLVDAFTTGLKRSTKGEALLYYLDKNPPEPGTKMYPKNADLFPSISQEKYLEPFQPESGLLAHDEDTSDQQQNQPG